MENIQGIEIKNLDFADQKSGDLIYHEGPLLSHFKGDNGYDYFYKWADANHSVNRWIVFRVTIDGMMDFFEKKTTLRNLILNTPPNFVYFLELDNDLNTQSVTIASPKHIPSKYLPSESSFFSETHYEPYATTLFNQLKLKSPKPIVVEVE